MVSVGKLKAGQERYYLDQVQHPGRAAAIASGAEDYYVDGHEPEGEWTGRAATTLGVHGAVDGQALRRLLAGEHPLDGSALKRGGSVAAYDVTFSAPKSVSVLFGIGDPQMQTVIGEAHRRAVSDAFSYLDDAVAVARRGAGGRQRIRGEGLVAASFLHRTSRAGDPQLHTHVVVANLVRAADGRWSALDGRLLYAHARTAGFLYQAALREELSRLLGVAWRPVEKGMAEIDGVPAKALRAFSRRRAEIEDAIARHGSSGREAAQVATLDTRRAKRDIAPERLAPEWRERANANGLFEWRIDRVCRPFSTAETPDWQTHFAQLEGPDGLTRERSSFSRRDVLQALSAAAGQGARVAEVTAAADAFLGRQGVIRLLAVGRAEPRYSTAELLAIESRILDHAGQVRGAGRGVANPAEIASALYRRPFLAAEQRDMVQRLAEEGDGVAIVIGEAGTGKTTALAAAKEAWEASGLPVRGCALARRAARELERKADVPSTSVAALLRRSRPLAPQTVLILDEAGMIGTRELDHVARLVEAAGGKLVLTGDPSQLPAIAAGGALAALAARIEPIVLRENRRQQYGWEREAVEAIRAGDADRAIELYGARQRIHVGSSDDEVFARLVADWHRYADPDGALMIAHRRADVRELNQAARALLRADGRLGRDELVASGGAFAVGDRVIVKRNDHRCDVRNGDRGVVKRIESAAGTLQVRIDEDLVELGARFLSQPTQSGRPSLEHGYAITAYAAQGLTCRHALVLARDDAYREWIYTAMTRGADANHIYVVAEPDRGRDRREFAPQEVTRDGRVLLAATLMRTSADGLAIDRLLPDRTGERSLGREL